MWYRSISAVLVFTCVPTGAYLYWCSYRVSWAAFVSDRNWPRPWPFPDKWLLRWEQRLNRARPAPPGSVKIEGEFPAIGEMLANCAAASLAVATAWSIPWLIWFYRRMRRPRNLMGDAADYCELKKPPTAAEDWTVDRPPSPIHFSE